MIVSMIQFVFELPEVENIKDKRRIVKSFKEKNYKKIPCYRCRSRFAGFIEIYSDWCSGSFELRNFRREGDAEDSYFCRR